MKAENEKLDLLCRRLDALEKRNKWLLCALVLSLITGGTFAVSGQTTAKEKQPAKNVYRGSGFQLIDNDGKVRFSVELSEKGEPLLRMVDAAGNRNVYLGPNQGSTTLALYDNKDRMTVSLGTGVIEGKDASISGLSIRDLDKGEIIRSANINLGMLELKDGVKADDQRRSLITPAAWGTTNTAGGNKSTIQLQNDVVNKVISLNFIVNNDTRIGLGVYQGDQCNFNLAAKNPKVNKSTIESEVNNDGPVFKLRDKEGKVVFFKP